MFMIRSADEVRDRDACIHVHCVRDGVSLTTQTGVRFALIFSLVDRIER